MGSDSKRTLLFAWITVIAGLFVFVLKYVAYQLTNSVSIYSDALESIVNIVTAGIAILVIHIAARPPDANHPYGHSKAEYFSVIVEGALILFAAFEIIRSAYFRLLSPVVLSNLFEGTLIVIGATLLNGILSAILINQGKRLRSPALVANGKHLWTDVFTTVGVLAGIGLATITQWWIFDPIVAVLVAINIIRVGKDLLRESIAGLMDESLSDEKMKLVKEIIDRHMEGGKEVHALRSRIAGKYTFIEFHLVVEGTLSVKESHDICDRLEAALHNAIPGSVVTIHVEPEDKAKHQGKVIRLGE